MKLTQADKSICVQGCENSYSRIKGQDIPEGHGAHGEPDWKIYINGEKGTNCVTWWQEFDGEEYSCGFTGYINHPTYGKIGVVCFQGTTDAYGDVGWKDNFTTNQVNQIKDFHNKKGALVIPYGNENSKIRMHEGIIKVYSLSRDRVRAFVKDCFNNNIPVWIFGHSQGGGTTTAAFVDFHYMLDVEMKIPQDKIDRFLTGYAASSLAIFNLEGAQSFNKRANGNFYNEWVWGDTVHDVPPWQMGYIHVEQQHAYSNAFNNIIYGPLNILHFVTVGFLPSPMAWNHDPRRLLAGVEGKPMPMVDPNTTKDGK